MSIVNVGIFSLQPPPKSFTLKKSNRQPCGDNINIYLKRASRRLIEKP